MGVEMKLRPVGCLQRGTGGTVEMRLVEVL